MIYVYNLHTYIGTITLGGHHQTLGAIGYTAKLRYNVPNQRESYG